MERRVNWIDWLKVIVVFGVFLYHAAQPFVLTTWLVNDPERSVLLSALAGAGYLFGMPLMFLLAGSATWLALGRRGVAGFVSLRVRRILVPLAVGIAFLSPAQAWVASGARSSPIAYTLDWWRALPLPLNPQWLGDYGYHLWFLGFLFAYSLLALPGITWLTEHLAGAARLTTAIAARGAGLLALLLPTLAIQLVVRPAAASYRDWADFALWGCYFGMGILAAADERIVSTVARYRWPALGATCLLGLAFVPVAVSGTVLDLEHAPGYGATGLAYVALRTTIGFALVCVFIGFAARHLTMRPRALGWASRAVLPFYVIHHPVIVVVAAWAVALPLGMWPKLGLICVVSLVLTVGVYELLVRGSGLLSRSARRGRRAPPLRLPGAEA